MKQAQKKEKRYGKEAFYAYYSSIFANRWDALEKALLLEPSYCSLCFEGGANVCTPYFLDAASVCAALCLPVKNAHSVLDVCAAPGGKSLVLSANLSGKAQFTVNERSAERRARLLHVLEESLPKCIQERIVVTGRDGATLCHTYSDCFDAILLDAPCSSERHVLKNPPYLEEWSPARTKNLSVTQWALLSSSWRILAKGGYLLYATCALSPQENDGIIRTVKKKFGSAVRPVPFSEMQAIFTENLPACPVKTDFSLENIFSLSEITQEGAQLLPDKSRAGPLYFSLLQKVN